MTKEIFTTVYNAIKHDSDYCDKLYEATDGAFDLFPQLHFTDALLEVVGIKEDWEYDVVFDSIFNKLDAEDAWERYYECINA